MLTIQGARSAHFCDGVSRRGFLRIGSLALGALGGFNLPQLLRAAESGNSAARAKSVINIFLPGGPPHQDMWDLKMDAPAEVRGEFSPIPTKVPGIEVCELFPKMAAMMDRFSIVRSVVGSDGQHASYQCFTGHPRPNSPAGGWPSMGAVVSKLEGSAVDGVPPFVGLSPKMGHAEWADPGHPGFAGPAYGCFNPNGGGAGDMVLKDISIERLNDRRALLASFDNFRRECDTSGAIEAMDGFTQQAFGVLTSSRLADALNIEKEDAATRDRYGRGTMKCRDDGGPECPEQFLLARRLVEAGVRCVTVGFNRWDWHDRNFKQGRDVFPQLDSGLTSLVADLHDRGLNRDVAVVVWGEFGRTPNINKDGGRDHWPRVSCAALAGGEFRHGQVIGATDRLGGEPAARPVDFQEIFATLYHHLGIDTRTATVPDLSGRPRYLVDEQFRPLPELV
ncbi:MAG: DUF1501 domain-containing protein [Chthoniobacteraceae bacterium]